jgi:hypothetical protein
MTIYYVPEIGSRAHITANYRPYQGIRYALELLDGTTIADAMDTTPLHRMADKYRLQLAEGKD